MNAKTDYAVAPGAYLAEWAQAHDIDEHALADRLGRDLISTRRVLRGLCPVDEQLAITLAGLTSIPSRAWLGYQRVYEADLARLDRQE